MRETSRDRVERAGAIGRLGDPLGQQLAQRLLTCHQELALVGEVAEERALRDPRALGDLRDRGGVVPLLVEQVDSGQDEPLSRSWLPVSGTPWVPGRLSTETDSLPTDGLVGGRGRTVTAVLGLASRGVRTSAVHALDAAVLMRLALERAPAGTAWHAVDDQGDAVRDIAAVIGRRLGLTVEALPEEHFGPLGAIFAMDQPSSSTYTQEELGWAPTRPSLLEDLENIQTESDRAGTMTR